MGVFRVSRSGVRIPDGAPLMLLVQRERHARAALDVARQTLAEALESAVTDATRCLLDAQECGFELQYERSAFSRAEWERAMANVVARCDGWEAYLEWLEQLRIECGFWSRSQPAVSA